MTKVFCKIAGALLSAALAVSSAPALAQSHATDRKWPSTTWEKVDPTAAGWSAEKLTQAEAFARSYAPTAVIIVQDGKVVTAWGDTARKANVRSVRKSLLSALYGIGVAEEHIKLNQTMGELGIDDRPPSLTAIEKQATIRIS